MEDERDAEDAIRALDRYEFGRKGRRLRVKWTKVNTFEVYLLLYLSFTFSLFGFFYIFILVSCSKNAMLDSLQPLEGLHPTQGPQKPCLLSILIRIILGQGIWRGILIPTARF